MNPPERSWEPIPLAEPLSIWDLPTPALVLDLDAFERNLKKMATFMADRGKALRPHVKTHKCPIIAHKQMDAGAVGVCAAKVSEAEVMAAARLEKILITSPVVTPDKIARLIALAEQSSEVRIVVDRAENVHDLNEAAAAAGIELNVLIDLDPGLHRTGIEPGEPALALLREIAACKSLRFGGLQFYAGLLMHKKGYADRRAASLHDFDRALETKAAMEQAGFEVPILTGGGTGTYNIDCDVPGLTDLQGGSYIFMDMNYRLVGGERGETYDDFEPSLFVLATAISQPKAGLITIDVGYKTMASDSDLPELRDISGVEFHWGGDEHGIMSLENPSREIKVGDKMLLIVSHCDPTVNLYDNYHVYRDETVEAIWPIAARGCSQ